jgi:hypothetical protein
MPRMSYPLVLLIMKSERQPGPGACQRGRGLELGMAIVLLCLW